MTVYNAVGEGPLSPPQEVFVGEAGEPCLPCGPSTPAPPAPAPPPPCRPLALHTHHPSRPPVPTTAPRHVAVHSPTATQLDVTWEPPPLESQNGDIQGYKVRGAKRRVQGSKGEAGGWE